MYAPSCSQCTFCAYVVRPASTHVAQAGERRADDRVEPGERAAGIRPAEHLPVAGDQHPRDPRRTGSPPRRAAPCPRAARGSRRRPSRPTRRGRRGRARSARAPSRRRRRPRTRPAFAATASATAFVPSANARPLEDAHRAVPEDRARLRDPLGEARRASRARCRARASRPGARRPRRRATRRPPRTRPRATTSTGSSTSKSSGFSPRSSSAILPPMSTVSARPPRLLQDAELVLDLRAAGDEHERPLDLAEQAAEMLELGEQQQSGVGRQQVRDGLGRGVRAVRRAERVVDVEVAAVGELAREALVVLRLARVEARVLEHVDALVRQELSQPRRDRRHRVLRAVLLRLRPAEMRADAHLGRAAPRAAARASAARRGCACRRRRARPRAAR